MSETKPCESSSSGEFDTPLRAVSENGTCVSSSSGEFDTSDGAVSETIHRESSSRDGCGSQQKL